MKMNENMMHCKEIADRLEQIVNLELYKCPECGEFIPAANLNYLIDNDTGDSLWECPECDKCIDVDYWEQVTLFDYFENVYDVEYRINSNKEYKSVCLMVACGGPNIYIDTAEKVVSLHWWTERAEYPLNDEVCEAIDEMWEEIYEC